MIDATLFTQDPELPRFPLLEASSLSYLNGFSVERIRPIVQETRRLKGRGSSTPWYAQQEEADGDVLWLRLAVSYDGREHPGPWAE